MLSPRAGLRAVMAAAPVAKPPGPATPAPPPPRAGDVADTGAVVRDRVRARSWRLEGVGRASQDVDVEVLQVQGDLTVGAGIVAERCDCDGRLSAGGAGLGSGAWTLSGETRLGGPLQVGSLTVEGRLDVRGDLVVGGALKSAGSLDVRGGIRAQSIHLDGSLTAGQDVNAPDISLVIRGPSKVPSLRARRIVVARPAPPWASEPPVLDVLEIEGEEVRLAGVTAQYVKADRITVGPGCQLSQVEGKILSQSPRSHVGPQSKSPAPKGLWR